MATDRPVFRTRAVGPGVFEDFVVADSLVRRRPFTAVKRISKITSGGKGKILKATEMDDLYENGRPQRFVDSVGHSLNLGVNELADVLHTFFLNVVNEE